MREIDLRREFGALDNLRTRRRRGISADLTASRAAASHVASDSIKRCVDVILAGGALIILSPMIMMVMAILLLTQGRPIFVAHRRIGKHGVLFPCLKFRTMVTNGEDVLARHLKANPELRAEWNATRKLKDDPRITPFGRLLRKNSVDEIPQLLNVLRGEMSLVGPRPIVSSEAELYGVYFTDYMKVRPGLTGLWQVSGRSDTSYGTRVELDTRYVAERSFWGDVMIMVRTIPAVLSSRGSY
ncbi:MAG: sugar transferase [Rhizobium sp.]